MDLRDEAETAQWARLYARDVFLSLEVFRLANERTGTHIVRLEQAPAIIGQERFLALGRGADVVEDHLRGEAREAFMAAVRRALIPARLAAMWARDLGFRIPEEFYFSALFANLGELLIRYLAPARGRLVDEGLGKGRLWDGREADVLGFGQRALGLALARDWDLPQLLLEDAPAEGGPMGKAGVVRGAVDVSAGPAAGRGEPRAPALLRELSERWTRSPQRLGDEVFNCVRDCARDALEWYPRAHDHRYVELYPRPHAWRPVPSTSGQGRREGGASTSAPQVHDARASLRRPAPPADTAAPPPAAAEKAAAAEPRRNGRDQGTRAVIMAPRPVPEAPVAWSPPDGGSAPPPAPPSPPPASSPRPSADAAPATTSDVISRVVHQIVTATRLERCLFLVMDRRKEVVMVRHHAGIPDDSPLGRLSVGLGDGNLFALVMHKPTLLWVDAEKRRQFQGAIRGPLRALTPAGEFLVASLFIKGRPLGLLYADGGPALTAAHLHNFKKAHGYLVRHLDGLASRPMAAAGD